MKNTAMTGDIENVFANSLDCYIKKLVLAGEKMVNLGVRLDPLLDKPYNDDNPKYACGDAMEEVKCLLNDTAEQLVYIKHIIVAKVASWERYPMFEDFPERDAFVSGYMEATK